MFFLFPDIICFWKSTNNIHSVPNNYLEYYYCNQYLSHFCYQHQPNFIVIFIYVTLIFVTDKAWRKSINFLLIICNILIFAKTVDVILNLSICDHFANDAFSRHIWRHMHLNQYIHARSSFACDLIKMQCNIPFNNFRLSNLPGNKTKYLTNWLNPISHG